MHVNNKTNIYFKQAMIAFFSISWYITLLVSIFHRTKEIEDSEDSFMQKKVSSSLGPVGFREYITDEEVFPVFLM